MDKVMKMRCMQKLTLQCIPNPMDWRAVDRFILLAALVLLAPVGFGSALLVTDLFAPEHINQTYVPGLLWLYGLHILLLTSMILIATSKRKHSDDWPIFENIIIASYIITVLVSSYLTGSHFSEGLLLIFLGVNITGTLASVNKIRKSYWIVVPVLIAMGITDHMYSLPHAPLLIQPMTTPDGRPLVGWLIVRDIIVAILGFLVYLCILAMKRWTERESLYLEMSTTDGLTRLSNRNFFINRGQEEIARTREQTLPTSPSLSCIMIDLDHFKQINDTWGHHAGDQVLIAASKVMMRNARQTDEVGRYGGEEFAMLLPGTSTRRAAQIAERIRRKISDMNVIVDGNSIEVTASFGVACFPSTDRNNMEDLLKAADKALYEAKETGRNKVVTA